MSLVPAFGSAASGLDNFQEMINVIGNNIANEDTTGFKASDVSFQDAISQLLQGATAPTSANGGTDPIQLGLGANVASVSENLSEGQLQNTGVASNIAIDGAGYFIVNTPSNGVAYTRNGDFTLDANNNLVDSNGDFVQGYSATNGVINATTLTNLNIPLGTLSFAEPTTTETFGGNFNADSPVAPTAGSSFTVTENVYDSLGVAHQWTITFTNLGPSGIAGDSNQWSYSIGTDAGTTLTANQAGIIDFTDTGTVDTANSTGGGAPVVTVGTYADGAATPQNITFDFTGFSQLSGSNSATVTNQDGVALGTLDNFSIGANGIITGSFTNGLQQTIGQVALANFSNAQGLSSTGNGLFQETANSGIAQVNTPETGGLGSTIGGDLESSNVDLNQEFTNLIVAQNAYQANARMITTEDTVLTDLIQAIGGV